MEENQKQSFWTRLGFSIWKRVPDPIKKFVPGRKTFMAMLLAAKTVTPSIGEANAIDEIETVPRTNAKIVSNINEQVQANPINSQNLTVNAQDLQSRTDTRSDLEKTINVLGQLNRGINNIEDFSNSLSNLGRSRNLESTLYNVENVMRNAQKGEQTMSQVLSKPSVKETQKVEKEKQSEKIENKKEKPITVKRKDKEKTQKNKVFVKKTEIENSKSTEVAEKVNKQVHTNQKLDPILVNKLKADKAYFDSLKLNPLDQEDMLSDLRINLKVRAGQINYKINQLKSSGSTDTPAYQKLQSQYKEIMQEYNEAGKKLNQLIERRKQDEQKVQEGIIEKEDAFRAEEVKNPPEYMNRKITPEKLQEFAALQKLDATYTPGQKLTKLSEGIDEIWMAIVGCTKNGDEHTRKELEKIYYALSVQSYQLQKEAQEHPNDPRYNLEMPKSYPKYELKNKDDMSIKHIKNPESIKIDKSNSKNVDINNIGKFDNLSGSLAQHLAEKPNKEVIIKDSSDKAKATKSKSENVGINDIGKFDDLSGSLAQHLAEKQNKEISTKKSSSKMENSKTENVDINDIGKFKDLSSTLSQHLATKNKHEANKDKIGFDSYKKDTLNRYYEDEER